MLKVHQDGRFAAESSLLEVVQYLVEEKQLGNLDVISAFIKSILKIDHSDKIRLFLN
jgi:hypothetical protein